MNFYSTLKSHFSTLRAASLLIALAFLASCNDDDSGSFEGRVEIYSLVGVGSSNSIGTATFTELKNGTMVTVEVSSTVSGTSLPMHIHSNTAAEGGDIAVTLNSVDGSSGMSETKVTALDNGTEVSFDDLTSYDGYINVHLSVADLATIVVQGDIGQNAFTGESETYTLNEVDVDGVSGTATFEERMNGETLVTVELMNTMSGDSHPMHIHNNSAAEGGGIAITLNSVEGESGLSKTNVSVDDAQSAIMYSALITFDGYINVHNSAEDLATLVAQGDIGANVQ